MAIEFCGDNIVDWVKHSTINFLYFYVSGVLVFGHKRITVMANKSPCSNKPQIFIDMSLNIFFLKVIGLLTPDKAAVLKYTLHNLYCCAILVMYAIIVAGNIAGMIKVWGDLEAVINNVISTVGVFFCMAKYLFLLYKRLDVALLLKMMLEFGNCQWPQTLCYEASQIATKATRKIRNITVGYTVYMMVLSLTWPVSPIITVMLNGPDPTGQRAHPHMTEYFFDTQTSPNYEIIYLFETVAVLISCIVTVAFDTLCVAFFVHAGGQFRIILASLQKLREVADESLSQDTDGEFEVVVEYGSCENGNSIYQEASKKNHIFLNLCSCVKHHNDIIKFVKKLDEVFNPIMLGHMLYSVGEIAICGLQATEKNTKFGELVKFAIFVSSLTFEVYLICRYADNIIQLSQEVATEAYSCEWYDMDPQIKTMLQIIIIRAQREVKLTAFHFKVLSIDTYGSLLNGAYSYFALLKEVKKGSTR